MTELQYCPECGSTMARIFKPKPGHRCIVCWKFYPDNPDLTIPLGIGIASGIAGGTAYALTSKAMEQNPQQINILYKKIKQKFPDLDYQTFLEAYDIAVRELRKPKFIVKKADIIPIPGGGYVAIPKEKQYEKELKELQNKIDELNRTIDFRYSNMGYYDEKSDIERKELIKEKTELIKQWEFQQQNPPRTHELYETFHGVPVDKTFKAKIPDPVGELEYVAKLDNIVYICQGKKAVGDDDGEDISYNHEWERAKMLLVRDEDKNYFIAGKCRVIKSGINDWKGKPTWSKNNFKVRIPKKVTYLGLLPELKAGGKIYRFTDTILCTDSKGQRLFITELTRTQPTHPEA